MSVVRAALREATSGAGSVLLITGEPGLGKTRLVHECRKLFLAWAGAASGRLPLWLEGRAASYTSSLPFGLYQQLLSAWVGAAPEADEERSLAALVRAMKAAFGPKADDWAGWFFGPDHGPWVEHGCGQRFTIRPRAIATGPLQGVRVAPVPARLVRRHSGRPGGPPLGRSHIRCGSRRRSRRSQSAAPSSLYSPAGRSPIPASPRSRGHLVVAPDLSLRKIELCAPR